MGFKNHIEDEFFCLSTFMKRASSSCFDWCLSTALCITSSTFACERKFWDKLEQRGVKCMQHGQGSSDMDLITPALSESCCCGRQSESRSFG